MADQRDGESPGSPSKPPVIPFWPWCVAKIKSYLHERRAERENEDPQDRFVRRTAGATVWIAILAVVAAVVGVLQYLTFKGQLAEMRDEQRPWVYADLGSGGAIYRNQVEGYTIPIAFTYHNTGHLPAMYAWPDIEGYLYGVGPDAALSSRDRQKKRCDVPMKSGAGDHLGATVFPGQTYIASVAIPISKEDIEAQKALWQKSSGKEMQFITPMGIGCIRYQAPDGGLHQTGVDFVIVVEKPGQFSATALPIDPIGVDPGTIKFLNWTEGGTAYAN